MDRSCSTLQCEGISVRVMDRNGVTFSARLACRFDHVIGTLLRAVRPG